jgi:protein-serine/threonine kinase
MMRRGSSYSTAHSLSPANVSDPAYSPSASSSAGSPNISAEGSPVNAPRHLEAGAHDAGDEVRFSVELTRLKNLQGLYSLDFKRLKGEAWTYAWIYQKTLE